MDAGSKLMLYVVVGGPIAIVLFLLLSMGPLGWFIAGFAGIGAMVVRSISQDGSQQGSTARNCPSCGAPNTPDRERCDYCGDPLS